MSTISKARKILPLDQLARTLEWERGQGKSVALCHGVFDGMHPGHVRYLNRAAELTDVLVVTVTPDRYVSEEPGLPALNEQLRVESIAALECVDYVALNQWPTSERTLEMLRPQYYVKGNERADSDSNTSGNLSDEEMAVRAIGGQIRYTDVQEYASGDQIPRHFRTFPRETEAYLDELRSKFSVDEVVDALRSLADLDVLVVALPYRFPVRPP